MDRVPGPAGGLGPPGMHDHPNPVPTATRPTSGLPSAGAGGEESISPTLIGLVVALSLLPAAYVFLRRRQGTARHGKLRPILCGVPVGTSFPWTAPEIPEQG